MLKRNISAMVSPTPTSDRNGTVKSAFNSRGTNGSTTRPAVPTLPTTKEKKNDRIFIFSPIKEAPSLGIFSGFLLCFAPSRSQIPFSR